MARLRQPHHHRSRSRARRLSHAATWTCTTSGSAATASWSIRSTARRATTTDAVEHLGAMSVRGRPAGGRRPDGCGTAAFPDLAGLSCRILGAGFDSVALEVDDQLVFKFPRRRSCPAGARPRGGAARSHPPTRHSAGARSHDRRRRGPVLAAQKIPGEHLRPEDYPLACRSRARRSRRRSRRCFAELHALDHETMRAAGALPIKPWLRAGRDRSRHRALSAWPAAGLGIADPRGLEKPAARSARRDLWLLRRPSAGTWLSIRASGRLNGIYDFADSGFAGLHQEFIYPAFVSAELMTRVIDHYEAITGRAIDRRRVHLLAAVLRAFGLQNWRKTMAARYRRRRARSRLWAELDDGRAAGA